MVSSKSLETHGALERIMIKIIISYSHISGIFPWTIVCEKMDHVYENNELVDIIHSLFSTTFDRWNFFKFSSTKSVTIIWKCSLNVRQNIPHILHNGAPPHQIETILNDFCKIEIHFTNNGFYYLLKNKSNNVATTLLLCNFYVDDDLLLYHCHLTSFTSW